MIIQIKDYISDITKIAVYTKCCHKLLFNSAVLESKFWIVSCQYFTILMCTQNRKYIGAHISAIICHALRMWFKFRQTSWQGHCMYSSWIHTGSCRVVHLQQCISSSSIYARLVDISAVCLNSQKHHQSEGFQWRNFRNIREIEAYFSQFLQTNCPSHSAKYAAEHSDFSHLL